MTRSYSMRGVLGAAERAVQLCRTYLAHQRYVRYLRSRSSDDDHEPGQRLELRVTRMASRHDKRRSGLRLDAGPCGRAQEMSFYHRARPFAGPS